MGHDTRVGLWRAHHSTIRIRNLHELGVVMPHISGNAKGVMCYFIIGKNTPMMVRVNPKVNYNGEV